MKRQQKSKTLNIALWAGQFLVALILFWAGYTKLFQPLEQVAQMLPWAAENPTLLKITGVLDLLGALGLTLPTLLKIQPKMTVYAAFGTIALMIAAMAFHLYRNEAELIGMNIFFLFIAAFIAWGRSQKVPVAAN
jgi:putative oxidoreductase